jgi:3',5'-cyclic-nucleotide phosphodiesterase
MKFSTLLLFALTCFIHFQAKAQSSENGFTIIPLGVKGGLDESNLSAYLVKANGADQFICLDAGTIYAGLLKATNTGFYHPTNDPTDFQKKYINSYFISHGHLDHTAGLVLNSPGDSFKKNIYAIPSVIDVLKSSQFSSRSWSNFANEGDKPTIGKYQYQYLVPEKEIEVPEAGVFVTPFVLSHVKPYESTAFLVRNQSDYLLYLGDTGPDEVEHSTQLANLWNHIAPLIQKKQLKFIFIEVSFSNKVADASLYGHLTPKWLMKEMSNLHQLAGDPLKEVVIMVTHMKPCDNCEITIKDELIKSNTLGLKLHFPIQGALIKQKD